MNFEGVSLFLQRIRFVYVAILLIALNFVIYLLFVVPQKQKISQLQSSHLDLRNKIRESQKEIRTLGHRFSSLQKAEQDLEMIYTQVLSEKQVGVPEIRQELEEIAGSLSVDRSVVSYDYNALPDYGLQQFKLSVPVEGTYRDIRRFINEIERSKHFLILERVDLFAERSGQGGDNLNLNFQLSTYLRDEEIKARLHGPGRASSRP